MKAIGIYGGSFDPVHLGHLITTRFIYEKRNLEKVIFIPNHKSPLKQDIIPTADEHRFHMLQLAIEPFPFFEVSDFEIKKNDVSYTFETLVEFKNKYEKLELIIGYDNLCVFDKWHLPEKILELAELIVMKRNTDIVKPQNIFFNSAILVDTPTIDITATDIRSRVKNNLTIDYLVPQKVKEYISRNRLYI
ncbi:MAG: nicotinate (nicotinamide) nucleotide adenylyltransferase [Ignavibacteriae bacterium HGW-Ignavibacteriae-3]|nr:MAG: nicotinate (nicotinamide) nucleotide adenylyltransferase [Ignavibacteriae bacterium HGW-Ignavibacteriae-3]